MRGCVRSRSRGISGEAEPHSGDVFEKALEKLWAHGGAIVDATDNVSRGQSDDWRDSYLAQGEQKRSQIEGMIRYAQSNHCRMASLVRHFGDVADGQKSCGICDFCAPDDCIAQRFRSVTSGRGRSPATFSIALTMNGRSRWATAYGGVRRAESGSRSVRRTAGRDGAGSADPVDGCCVRKRW